MDNEIFTNEDLKLYQGLSLQAKGIVKQSFIEALSSKPSRKTVQRLFNEPSRATSLQQTLMKICLRQVIENLRVTNQSEIEKAKKLIVSKQNELDYFSNYLQKNFMI